MPIRDRLYLETALSTSLSCRISYSLFLTRVGRLTSDILNSLTPVSDAQWDNEQIQQETSLHTEIIETEILSSTYEIPAVINHNYIN